MQVPVFKRHSLTGFTCSAGTTYMPQIPMLPQQPNYTVHTSRAATTNRAPTQRAEESTDSDDNDDRIYWQKVSGRGKKRASPKITGVSTLRKKKPQGTNNSSV
jgi:hypothetical protein